jgi:sirohydrochlorin cobaltochelatase
MKRLLLICIIATFCLAMGTQAENNLEKKGILLITFGTSYPEARKTFDHVDSIFKKQWPDVDVRWAYTASFIRQKLEGQGIHVDSPTEALAKMGEAGCTHVAVQSLHFIPGAEFHDVLKTVGSFNRIHWGIKKTTIGGPLISKHQDMQQMANFICKTFPAADNKKEAVLLMGHGSHHAANVYYPAFQYYLEERSPDHFIGTVEGYPLLDEVTRKLDAGGYQKIKLVPFMSVAGNHAQNDMAGDQQDSWKSQLEAKGYQVEIVMKGLADYDEVVQIWIDHLKEAFDAL